MGLIGLSMLASKRVTTPLVQLSKRAASTSTTTQSSNPRRKGYLILEDGSIYSGYAFGYIPEKAIAGEAVFNTGMVGYNESLTDPSYKGQFLTFTYPLIGNYGVPPKTVDDLGLLKYFESDRMQVSAVLVAKYEDEVSHWNADQTLEQWMISEKVPGLTGLDTRQLTKRLRERGSMLGKIILEGQDDIDLRHEDPNKRNLVAEASSSEIKTYGSGDVHIVALDCGMKNNIIRRLCEKGAKVTVVPWNYDFRTKLAGQYDGVFISNGPGDPSLAQDAILNLRAAMQDDIPMFGICMGNQLMAHACGAKTYKLPFGNRGQNQPAMDTTTNRVYITPQNHGFAVDSTTLPANWEQYFVNTNDLSNEGLMCTNKPFFSVQFHPEASSGPEDTDYLFDKFLNMAREHKKLSAKGKFYTTAQSHTPVAVKKALVLGSGGLQIGQAGEFDYSGSQAIKALKEEGVETVLINPNIATIQTADGLADKVYFHPVNLEFVTSIIEKERPDGLMLQFGGQTALNTGLQLDEAGVLQKYNCRVLGTSTQSIRTTEGRDLFAIACKEIGEPICESVACTSVEACVEAGDKLEYPVIV